MTTPNQTQAEKLAAALAAFKASDPTAKAASQPALPAPKLATSAPSPAAKQVVQTQLTINAPIVPPPPLDLEKVDTRLDKTNPTHVGFLDRLNSLEHALLQFDPQMKEHLKQIHMAMQNYDEIVPLLTDEELATIMRAMQSHTKTILAVEAKTSAGKKALNAKAAKIQLSDL